MAPTEASIRSGDTPIHSSLRTLVLRRTTGDSGRHVIVKIARGAHAARRVRRELQALHRLRGVEGVVRLAERPPEANAIAFEDCGLGTLSQRMNLAALSLELKLKVACKVTSALARVHRAGVIHGDVNPSNILVNADLEEVVIADFDVSIDPQAPMAPTVDTDAFGTLAYMSPEQTGRTGRAVDLRSDLYSLGVTLYELATGTLPFAANDALQQFHDHLALVPRAPHVVDPMLPPILSQLIMKLLEKDPDRRYQTAVGVLSDLRLIRDALPAATSAAFTLGRFDFAADPLAPASLVEREQPLRRLHEALARCRDGYRRGVLVSGGPGVGKSSLMRTLRDAIRPVRGLYAFSKFDQYRQDHSIVGADALRTLGGLLLAGSDEQLALYRTRIHAALGRNVGYGPCVLPEFALLLGPQRRVEVSDPREAEALTTQTTVALLRSIAQAEKPLVLVFDDIQWAPAASLRLLEAILTEAAPIPGLLVVCGCRSTETPEHPQVRALIDRCALLGNGIEHLHLSNLQRGGVSRLLAEMLRLPEEDAETLSYAICAGSDGNPYDTVELITALRRDGVLTPGGASWHWNPQALADYVSRSDITGLLARRLSAFGPETVAVLEVMACSGGEIASRLIELGCDARPDIVLDRLRPALEEGLVLPEFSGGTRFRFAHDRAQQAVLDSMSAARKTFVHLALARRLSHDPLLASFAAAQYLTVADALDEPEERRRAARLLGAEASRLREQDFEATERYLGAAIGLLRMQPHPADAEFLGGLTIERHRALYGSGRLNEADEVFSAIVEQSSDADTVIESTAVQMYSLAHRGRHASAMTLGMRLLADLGLAIPQDLAPEIHAGLARVRHWVQDSDRAHDFSRPMATDPKVLAWSRLIARAAITAYFCDMQRFTWLVLESHRLWVQEGPCGPLMPSVGALPFVLCGIGQDHRSAYEAARHLVAVGDARSFAPHDSVARAMFSLSAEHWVEPLEASIAPLRRARAALMQAGEFPFVSYTYQVFDSLLDCELTLTSAIADIEEGMAFATRRNDMTHAQRNLPRRQLLRALLGETVSPGSFDDASFDEAGYLQSLGPPNAVHTGFHVYRAITAAIFADAPALAYHAALAMALQHHAPGPYVNAIAYLLHGLSLAEQARGGTAEERDDRLCQARENCLAWLEARAADAPENFRHLQLWLEAEIAWATQSMWITGDAFERAAAAARHRPWHAALITERAGLFHIDKGMVENGRALLLQAADQYEKWGAYGKHRHLVEMHALGAIEQSAPSSPGDPRATFNAEAVDMMAVLRASQALSSETSLSLLTSRLGTILCAMTGATAMRLLMRPAGEREWYLSDSLESGQTPISAEEAGGRGLLPISAVRYAERTTQLLIVDDAVRDDRFGADAYFAGMSACSMLLMPIFKQGELHALLLLESRNGARAFGAERVEPIALIAGQLSVSLENASLYASMERKVAERTAALEEANLRLEHLSMTDALTTLANRRRFNEALAAAWDHSLRERTPLGLAIVDIDFFKLYNDHYGHLGGDRCLRQVADAMRTVLRAGVDLAARFGGEEFAILLPGATPLEVAEIAERLRVTVDALREPHERSAIGCVTVSIGATSVVAADGLRAEDLIRAADDALYDAKRNGRNRIGLRQQS